MSQTISNELMAQIFSQNSSDPLLTLLTLSHSSFAENILLVNNTENIISRGNTYVKFPVKITLAPDDGETAREIQIEFDNVSLYLTSAFRTVTTPIEVKIEMVLASIPNEVQVSIEELKIRQIQSDKKKISAKLYMDDFLTTGLTSERYTPTTYPGLF